MTWIGRLQGFKDMDRIYGPDLMLELCAASTNGSVRHFLYGGAPGVAELLRASLESRFPGCACAERIRKRPAPEPSRQSPQDQKLPWSFRFTETYRLLAITGEIVDPQTLAIFSFGSLSLLDPINSTFRT